MSLSLINAAMAASNEIPAASAGTLIDNRAFLAIAAALCIGLGVLGASKAMGMIAKAALEGTARQPEMGNKLFTSMLIAMALVEALAIYCLLIAFMILAKV